jgi:hypothetical protein
MAHKSKTHLIVQKDKINQWYSHQGGKYRVQLSWDPRLWGYWIEQYARKVGKTEFMKDLTIILREMEKDKKAAFNLYELE